jgi:hypothetical protein
MEPHASTALTAVGLAALRRAAVMAHTVGTISLHLTAGGESIVDVRPDLGADVGRQVASLAHPARTVDPCGFRMAVASAWADHRMGREIGLVGLRRSDDLTIDWSVAAPGLDLGLGAVRAVCGGRVVWAFASVLDPPELAAVMAELDGDDDIVAGACDGITARLVHDDLLDATVVHVEVDPTSTFVPAGNGVLPPGPSLARAGTREARTAASTRVLDEVLRRMVAVVGAAELTMQLTT